MNCNPTLTAEEFKTVHNALWELDQVRSQLEEVLKPELYIKLARAATDIRKGLAGAYEQDSKSFELKQEHYSDVQHELGLTAVWSCYDANNLSDSHPFEGVDRVLYKDHWGDDTVSSSINGLTWSALYVAANACIRDSGDEHHMYIEGFKIAKDDPRTLILSTGS